MDSLLVLTYCQGAPERLEDAALKSCNKSRRPHQCFPNSCNIPIALVSFDIAPYGGTEL